MTLINSTSFPKTVVVVVMVCVSTRAKVSTTEQKCSKRKIIPTLDSCYCSLNYKNNFDTVKPH